MQVGNATKRLLDSFEEAFLRHCPAKTSTRQLRSVKGPKGAALLVDAAAKDSVDMLV